MMDIQNFIGQSSSEADRQREYYNRMKAEKEETGRRKHRNAGTSGAERTGTTCRTEVK